MTQTQFFESLGAPLKNTRWSWGAVRFDGVVFLRVWQDQSIKVDGIRYMRATYHSKVSEEGANLGYLERLEQIEAIKAGSRSYLVMCQADLNLLPSREIIGFDTDDLFLVGELIDREGDVWLEMKERVAARSVRRLFNS